MRFYEFLVRLSRFLDEKGPDLETGDLRSKTTILPEKGLKSLYFGRIESKGLQKENDCNHGELRNLCQNFPLDHRHVLLYIPNPTNIHNVLKRSVAQVLSTAQNAYAKNFTVSYPEKFIKSEADASTKRSFCMRGEKFNLS